MASNRATKHGIAAEAQAKMNDKWDNDRARVALEWIGQRIGEPIQVDGSMDSVYDKLNDGVVLAKLANWVKPGCIGASKYSKVPTMAFKKMELIGLFLQAIDDDKLVKKAELFQTVDLYERVNLVSVIVCIESLGRALITQGREGFGKAESKGEHKEWTEEQMRAGQNIISLQMGSNKGANQSGVNFGKGRKIVD